LGGDARPGSIEGGRVKPGYAVPVEAPQVKTVAAYFLMRFINIYQCVTWILDFESLGARSGDRVERKIHLLTY
jgi:hypothetical protein